MCSTKKLSIIIPVYNSDKYLRECLESIMSIVTDSIEIIVVNDGSTDNSDTICEQFYHKNSNYIKYIVQKNCGPSHARNVGIKHASGEYIQFIDADDYLDVDGEKALFHYVKNNSIELLVYNAKLVGTSQKKCYEIINSHYKSGKYDVEEFLKNIEAQERFWALYYVWNKLYKREIIQRNHIVFDENLNIGEDFLFNIEYVKKVHIINIVDDMIYCHRKRVKGSLTMQRRTNELQRRKYIDKQYVELYQTYQLLESYWLTMTHIFGESMYYSISNMFVDKERENIEEKKNFLKQIYGSEYKEYILKYLFEQKSLLRKIEGYLIRCRFFTLYIKLKGLYISNFKEDKDYE